MQAIAEVPLTDERTTEAHDFDALFREAGTGVFRTLYAYTGGRRDIAEEAMPGSTGRRSDWRTRSCGRSADEALHPLKKGHRLQS